MQSPRVAKGRTLWLSIGAAILVVLMIFVRGAFHHVSAAEPAKPALPPVTATLAVATAQQLPIYATGIGTVQANFSVTLHARVNGQLVNVAFREGQDVKQGDLLVQIDPAPYRAVYNAAAAQTAKDQANYENAMVDLKRYTTLGESDSISQQTLDTQKATVAQAKAAVEVDKAQADAAKVNLDYTTIRSPISGRVGLRLVDPGNIVQTSDTQGLVVINQIDPISVVFTLPEDKFQTINHAITSQATPLTVDAFAREDNALLAHGKLVLINNQIDSSTGTVQLKATFANPEHHLWPGGYVNIHVITATSSVVTVPAAAIQRGNDGLYIWTVDASGIAALVKIDQQLEQDGLAVIKGIPAGTKVVTEGQYRLRPGVKVMAQNPNVVTSAGAIAPGQPQA